MSETGKLPSSFRDQNGYLFVKEGILYRQINLAYEENYIKIHNSGLYEKLVDHGWMTPYTEVLVESDNPHSAYKVVQPELGV